MIFLPYHQDKMQKYNKIVEIYNSNNFLIMELHKVEALILRSFKAHTK